jgi:hypothetical protein
VVTIRSGIRSLRLKLWDEESRSLVGFPRAWLGTQRSAMNA